MKNKRQALWRLCIYLLFAFGLAWIPWIAMNKAWGFSEWFSTGHYALIAELTLFTPAAANLLTRLVTKEGFSDMKLHLRLKGHLPQYLAAWLLPVAGALLAGAAATAAFGDPNGAGALGDADALTVTSTLLLEIFTGPLMAFVTFGEEFGWRGYMNDKLKPLAGKTGTVVIGGILWGIWHAPLTVEGHNFGLDYPGYPYVGFLLMALFGITVGTLLMWLTERSGSVYPAAICHAMINFGSTSCRSQLMRGVADISEIPGSAYFAVMFLPFAVITLLFLIPLLRRRDAAVRVQNAA